MRTRLGRDEAAEIQMGPMIDCVFLLLLYFIASAQIKPEEKYLGLMMPGTGGRPESPPVTIVIGVAENNQVTFNEMPLDGVDDRSLPALRAKLQDALRLFGRRQPVAIHPASATRHQRVVDVLNACAGAGVENLSFVANRH